MKFRAVLFCVCLTSCIAVEQPEVKERTVTDMIPKAVLGAYVLNGPQDQGPPTFNAQSFQDEVVAFCDPSPCVPPEKESDPILKLKDWESKEITELRNEFRNNIAGIVPTPPSDPRTPYETPPQPLLETLKYRARLYTGDGMDKSGFVFTRLMLTDLIQGPAVAQTYRKYELKRAQRAVLEEIVLLDFFTEINQENSIIDQKWLEAERIVAYEMRRNLAREHNAREVWQSQKVSQ